MDDVLGRLTRFCEAAAQGRYEEVERLFAIAADAGCPAEIARLAEAFGSMVVQVEVREFRLSGMIDELRETQRRLEDAQRRLAAENVALKDQVIQLRIEIDQTRKSEEVAEITETEYFRSLRDKAQAMRRRGRSAG